jgi:hypothetical protein
MYSAKEDSNDLCYNFLVDFANVPAQKFLIMSARRGAISAAYLGQITSL